MVTNLSSLKKHNLLTILFLFSSLFFITGCQQDNNSDATNNSSSSEYTNIQEYILSNNENHVFDSTFEADSNYRFGYVYENPGIPFSSEVIESIKGLASVKEISPNYTLYARSLKELLNKDPFIVSYTTDTSTGQLDLQDSSFHTFVFKSFRNDDLFYDAISFCENNSFSKVNTIYKTFDSDSGIYIHKQLYDTLGISEDAKNLQIEVNVIIPTYFTFDTTPTDIVQYTQQGDYEHITYTFDIQGVIQSGNNYHFSSDTIMIPYELSQQLFMMVDHENVDVPEGCEQYQDNSYTITIQDGFTKEQLVKDLKTVISDFILTEQAYGASIEDFGTTLYSPTQEIPMPK